MPRAQPFSGVIWVFRLPRRLSCSTPFLPVILLHCLFYEGLQEGLMHDAHAVQWMRVTNNRHSSCVRLQTSAHIAAELGPALTLLPTEHSSVYSPRMRLPLW